MIEHVTRRAYCNDDQQDAHLTAAVLLGDLAPDDLDKEGMDIYARAVQDFESIACPKCRILNNQYLSSSGMLLAVPFDAMRKAPDRTLREP